MIMYAIRTKKSEFNDDSFEQGLERLGLEKKAILGCKDASGSDVLVYEVSSPRELNNADVEDIRSLVPSSVKSVKEI